MKKNDLILFHQSAPKEFKLLRFPTKKIKLETFKILLSHFIDLCISLIITILVTSSLSEIIPVHSKFAEDYLVSSNISFSLISFPFVVLNYFFFSYLMNHGQSIGMHVFSKRIKLNYKSISEALIWATRSTALVLSFGLTYFVNKSPWQNYQDHDYLYLELINFKNIMFFVHREVSAEAKEDEMIKSQRVA